MYNKHIDNRCIEEGGISMDDPMRAWCRGVAKYIRFRYDRAAVEEEE